MYRFHQSKRGFHIRGKMTKTAQNSELDRISAYMREHFPVIHWEGVRMQELIVFSCN